MEYAVNKLTSKIESADQATGAGLYMCPICRARVSHCSGLTRKKYFAHWRGLGSSACENFIPSLYGQNIQGNAFTALTKRRMDLRLVIKKGLNRAAWSIELALPSCRSCQGSVTVDVGGRFQHINMRGMTNGFQVMAELSVENFRIISYDGDADPLFVAGVDRECPGLPSSGAAAFTAAGRGEIHGFPRAQELRGSETYALLWMEPSVPDFPEELVLDRFEGREGWSLTLATIPEKPSTECAEWLQSFTGLIVNPPVPSITTIWPFLTRNSSINAVEYVESTAVLISAHMMPLGRLDGGPTVQVFGGNDRLSATGIDRSPALFILTPEKAEHFRVGKDGYPDIEKFFSCTPSLGRNKSIPGVELAFTDREGIRLVVPFHQRKCQTFVMAARAQEMTLEYLAVPPGATGRLRADLPSGHREMSLSSGDELAFHSQYLRLLSSEIQASLISYLTNPTCHLDLDFGGFGRLRVFGERDSRIGHSLRSSLGPSLRSRLRSYMFQLQISAPIDLSADDYTLVHAFSVTRPQLELVPNHRTLAKDILACGFELKH